MSKRSSSFIKNKWVGAASQITRRTIRETTSDDPIGLGTIRRGAMATAADAAAAGGRRNATPPEWREFSREMIDVLREIQRRGRQDTVDGEHSDEGEDEVDETTVSLEEIGETTDDAGEEQTPPPGEKMKTERKRVQRQERMLESHKSWNEAFVHTQFLKSRDFVKQFLLVCLENRRGYLATHIDVVAKFVINEQEVKGPNYWTGDDWANIFDELYMKAVSMEDTMALREALASAHDAEFPKIRKPRANCPALIKACLIGHVGLVKLLVRKGYFLLPRFMPDERHLGWRGYFPSISGSQGDDCSTKSLDEVQNLHVLRAMAKPCYVLTCYTVVASPTLGETEKCNFVCCRPALGLVTFAKSMICDDHNCPLSPDFAPNSACTRHPECNDPVYRCFKMSSTISHFAKWKPEFREEYLEVAESFNHLAVELLEECWGDEEVELFLGDPVGSNQFFRKGAAKRLKNPRLSMALVNEHLLFASHMFCQNILKRQWLGRAPLEGKNTRFKMFYFLAQSILFGLFPLSLCYVPKMVIEEFQIAYKGLVERHMSRKVYDALRGPNNLDDPVNRFIVTSFSHFLFLFLIFYTTVQTIFDDDQILNNFHWYHIWLVLLTTSLIAKDITVIRFSRSLSLKTNASAVRVWHIYDILTHIVMVIALLARLLMGKIYPCDDNNEEACDVEARMPFDTISNCLFSISSAMAGVRCLYWFQLHDRFGPIVINFTKVIFDLLTFVLIYLTVWLSFALSLVPLDYAMHDRSTFNGTGNDKASDDGDQSSTNGTHLKHHDPGPETTFNFWNSLWKQMSNLFWLTLSAEDQRDDDQEITPYTETINGFMSALTIIFAILTVIIFMNLLIATMNNTIQKVSDRQQLQWKFVRAGIWIDFFGDEAALPPPWNLVTVAVIIIKFIYKKSKKVQLSTSTVIAGDEGLRQDRQKQRIKLKKLNLDLIERYWNTQQMLEDQPLGPSAAAFRPDARYVTESSRTSCSPRRQSSGDAAATPLGMQERKLTRQETSRFNFAAP